MLQRITVIAPGEYYATVTSKGQITIPANVRTHLKLNTHRKVALVIEPDGMVHLKAPKYLTLESIFGAVKALKTFPTLNKPCTAIAEETLSLIHI